MVSRTFDKAKTVASLAKDIMILTAFIDFPRRDWFGLTPVSNL